MKLKTYLFGFFVIVLFALPFSAHAQMGGGMGGMGGGNRMGGGGMGTRGVGPGANGSGAGRKKTDKPMDIVDQNVAYYKKELKLDDFQVAAFKEVLEEYRQPIQDIAEQQDITKEEKTDKFEALGEKINARLLPLMSADQKTKYLEIQEKRKKKN